MCENGIIGVWVNLPQPIRTSCFLLQPHIIQPLQNALQDTPMIPLKALLPQSHLSNPNIWKVINIDCY